MLYLAAVWRTNESGFIVNEAGRSVALLIGLGLPHFWGVVVGKSKPRIENVLITTLILLLLTDLQTGFGLMFILGLVTALVKTVFRFENRPLFNPAAAGLFATSFFGLATTWWGIRLSPRLPFIDMSLAMLLTLLASLYLIWLYKRIPILVSVPTSLALVYFLLKGVFPLTLIFEGTFIFFLLVMAVEPKTTPVINWQAWLYGSLLGSSLALLFVFRIVGEPYLAALLAANLSFGLLRCYIDKT